MKFDFIKHRKIWYIISLLIILPGIFSLLTQGLNKGIDFEGGTIMVLKFDKPVKVENVRDVLADLGLERGAQVQSAGANEVFIRTNALAEEERNNLKAALTEKVGKVEITKEEKVGPKVGRELTINALLALTAAAALMVVYITWRFEFKSGLATVIALLHDVFIALSVFSIFQLEVDSAFIAAILTIIGYSINNTIVVFDRIRENNQSKKQNESLEEVVNKSTWQSMSRSINTSLTVLFVTLSLYFLGGATLKNFVLAITIGVSVGLYSSLLIASSLWIDLKKREKTV